MPRVDDRRVISGIVHVLVSGCRWKDAPPVYSPRKTLRNRFQRWAARTYGSTLSQMLATAGGPPAEVLIDSSAVKAHRCASGQGGSVAKRSAARAGERITKIHALTDRNCRPIAFLLIGGQVADCIAADILFDQVSGTDLVHGNKGYDTNAVRRKIEERGAAPNIPPKVNRICKNCFSPCLYRNRNAIERLFCRLKDFRRIAIRYDRLATNFHAALCIAAIIAY